MEVRRVKERGFEFSIYVILVILAINSILILHYNTVIRENKALEADVLELSTRTNEINANVNKSDMALRGYIISPVKDMIVPYQHAQRDLPVHLGKIKSLLKKYGYDVSKMQAGEKALLDYFNLLGDMIDMVSNGNNQQAIDILKTDPGFDAWSVYSVMLNDVRAFTNELDKAATAEYNTIVRNTRISQIALLIIIFPFLIAIGKRLRKTQLNRRSLFIELIENHQKYLHNTELETYSNKTGEIPQKRIIESIVNDLKKASEFISKIAEGDYSVQWNGMTEENLKTNQETLSGELIKMRDKMFKVKQKDDIRLWITEGLSRFSDIIRNYQSSTDELSNEVISNLVKYLKVVQGGIFILNDEDKNNPYLELTGCYAYDRKKFIEKKVRIGDGLIGQCFLEKEHIYLKEVPDNFANISSGLGETKPKSVLLVPLKAEDNVIGVIEIASLKEFENFQIDFLNQLAESIGTALVNAKNNQITKQLLEKSQQQAEEMKAQEEEMRQNMEELQATQENAYRREAEMNNMILALEKSFHLIEFEPNGEVLKMNNQFSELLKVGTRTDYKTILKKGGKTDSKINRIWQEVLMRNIVKEESNYMGTVLNETFIPIIDEDKRVVKILHIGIQIEEEFAKVF